MKFFSSNGLVNNMFFKIIFLALLCLLFTKPVSAHVSPAGCSGSGLGIDLFTNVAQANIGDPISYSVTVFNGSSGSLVVCDADSIQASLVTPDGVSHPVALTRTALSKGDFDFYPNVVSYTARLQDITPSGTLAATASDTGVIHQNITDSQGGGNQGLNVFVLNTLHIIKQVVNSNGGTATTSSFSVHVKKDGVDVAGSPATGAASPGTLYSLIAGTYSVGEDANPSYTQTFSGDCDASGSVTLLGSDDKTCTITNTDSQPTTTTTTRIHLLERACPSWSVLAGNSLAEISDDTAGHFTEFTNYASATPHFPANYSPKPINPAEILPSCVPKAGWNFKLATDSSLSQNVTTVGLTDGSGEVIVPFNSLTAAQQTTLSSGNQLWVKETPQSSFPFAALRCHNDAVNGDDLEFIRYSGPAPADIYCIAYNVDKQPASINVVKTIINDNGRTKTISDFPLFVNGTPVVSGITNVFPANANYAITETADPNYTASFSGDCDAGGHLSLAPGEHKICIVTNDDIAAGTGGGGPGTPVPPLIDVVKVPSPLALPNGPGPVTYTYTLRNVGTVPVTDITMVGDTCSPIILLSGDTNNDSKLDVAETWIYGCATSLTATHTNTVVATGFANGISAVDTASATVVVGTPGLPNTGGGGSGGSNGGGGSSGGGGGRIVPPLIHITKVPSPSALTIGGGFVTYTNVVTNPGIVAISNVRLTDDKCSAVSYVSGDTNNDSKLDTSEAWVYTCRALLTQTTTNTVAVEGFANGISARDFAIATVVVPVPRLPNTGVPGLPNTGYPPREEREKSAMREVALFASSIILVSVVFSQSKKNKFKI